MELDSTVPFIGLSMMMAATLALCYYRGQPNCSGTRATAFILLLLGEMLLFPWHSPLDWLKLAMIAGANFVLGVRNEVLDGVAEWLRGFFRPPPGTGPATGAMLSKGEKSATRQAGEATSDSGGSALCRTIGAWGGSPLVAVLRRMFWPDLPV